MNKMKTIIIILLMTSLLIPIVLGQDNILIWKDKNVSNYTLLFLNLNTSMGYATRGDITGKFDFLYNYITDNMSRKDLIKISICKNILPPKSSNKEIFFCEGVSGYFYVIEHSSSLAVNVNSKVSTWPKYITSFSDICSDENLYFCSVILGNNTNIFYNSYFQTDYFESNVDSYTFENIRLDTLPSSGIYSLSRFASDGANSILNIDQFYVNYINITNPYPEKGEAIIKTEQPNCLLKNGKNEITEIFEAKETKVIPIFTNTPYPCKIEYNFIKIINPKFSINISIIEFSLISILGLSIYLIFKFLKRKK